MISMALDFAAEPTRFFRARLQEPLSWPRVMAAPLLCVVLHTAAYVMISRKVVEASLEVLSPPTDAAYSFLMTASVAFPFLTSLVYVVIWLMATGMLVCIEILNKDSGDARRLLKLTGLAYYALLPYLLAAVVLAFSFQPPSLSSLPLGGGPEFATEFRAAVQSTLTISLLRDLGYVFHAWLMYLFAAAYRASSSLGAVPTLLIALLLYVSFFVVYAFFT